MPPSQATGGIDEYGQRTLPSIGHHPPAAASALSIATGESLSVLEPERGDRPVLWIQ